MFDRVKKILQVIAFVVGAALTLMGHNAKVQIEADAAAGVYASREDGRAAAAADVSDAGNLTTAGIASFFAVAAIPFVFQFLGPWFGKASPGFRAGADRSACETLLLTRADSPGDLAKVEELIESGFKLEVAQKKAQLKVSPTAV